MNKNRVLMFTVEEYRDRLTKVQNRMKELDLDCLVVADPVDLFWLTGYHSHGYQYLAWQATVVPKKGDPVMLTRHMEEIAFRLQAWPEELYGYQDLEDPMEATRKVLKQFDNVKRVGISKNSAYVRPVQLEKIVNIMPEAEFVDTSDLILNIRIVKSPAEVGYIREAARILNLGVMAGVEAAHEGCTENDIAAAAVGTMIREGGEDPASRPFMGVGYRSPMGHGSWERAVVKKGDVIYLETGGCYNRYHAAMMRTMSIGQPSKVAAAMGETTVNAVNAAIAAIKPGATSGDVDAASRGTVTRAGFGDWFRTRSGYSIGPAFVGWLDGPSIKKNDPTILLPGMTFHLICFLTDFNFSVSSSETVLVTETGCEKLTNVPQVGLFIK